MNKLVIGIALRTLGVVAALFLNYFVLEPLIIPDPCYYHSRDTNLLFDLFYDIPSVNGGHPFPSLFNLLITLAAGLLAGRASWKWWAGKKRMASKS